MSTRNLASAEAGPAARDVMLAAPKTFPATLTVAEARTVMASPKQKLLLVCDGSRYLGAVRREGLEGAADGATIDTCIDADVPTLAPTDRSDGVPDIVERSGLSRIPVVDEDGDLLGLICFNAGNGSYCVSA